MNPTQQAMLALHLRDGQLSLAQTPTPRPAPGEARIKVHLAGICSTDLHLVRGYKGFAGILGHEFVGTVDACDDPAWIGRRVVGEINLGCGVCLRCRRGRSNHCVCRRVLGILDKNGAFAQWLTLPIDLLHGVPDAMPDADAVFVEPVAAALRVLEQVHITPGDKVAVLGDGKLGLLVGQVMARRSSAARVVQFGRHPKKLALAASWGAEVSQVGDVSQASGDFDVVIEATGTRDGLTAALAQVRPEGCVMLKSTFHGLAQVDVSQIVVGEVRLVGSRCGPFGPAIEALSRGDIEVQSMVEAIYGLPRGLEAFEHAARRGALKVLIEVP